MKANLYNSEVFNNLNSLDVATVLLRDNRHYLDDLGKIICDYGMQDFVGITLLHKHFDLFDKEILTRTFSNNVINIRPELKNFDNVIPYMWAFNSDAGNPSNFYPIEFITLSPVTSIFRQKVDCVSIEVSFLESFGVKLGELGLSHVFGLSLIPYSLFSFKENEILIERDYNDKRELVISTGKKRTIPKMKTIQTLWTFSKVNGRYNLECDHECHHCLHCDHTDIDIDFPDIDIDIDIDCD